MKKSEIKEYYSFETIPPYFIRYYDGRGRLLSLFLAENNPSQNTGEILTNVPPQSQTASTASFRGNGNPIHDNAGSSVDDSPDFSTSVAEPTFSRAFTDGQLTSNQNQQRLSRHVSTNANVSPTLGSMSVSNTIQNGASLNNNHMTSLMHNGQFEDFSLESDVMRVKFSSNYIFVSDLLTNQIHNSSVCIFRNKLYFANENNKLQN